jgi:chemotaxis protein CheX
VDASHELVGAFTEAVPTTLREMAGVEAVVRDSRPGEMADLSADLVAAVGLTMADGEGRVELCLPERTAVELARRVLAGAVDRPTADLVRDCMGEVANVAAGQAKALLVGTASHFVLSTPVVRAGGRAGGPAGWWIRFESEAGEFGVHLRPPA